MLLREALHTLGQGIAKSKPNADEPPFDAIANAGRDVGTSTDSLAWLDSFSALTVEESEDIAHSMPTLIQMARLEVVQEDLFNEDAAETHVPHTFFQVICLFGGL